MAKKVCSKAARVVGSGVLPSQAVVVRVHYVTQINHCSFNWVQNVKGRLYGRTDMVALRATYLVKTNGDIVRYDRITPTFFSGGVRSGGGFAYNIWEPNNHVVYVGWKPGHKAAGYVGGRTYCWMLFDRR